MGPSKGAGMKPSFNPVGTSLAGRGGITGRQAGSTAAKGGRMMTAQATVGDQRPMTSIKGTESCLYCCLCICLSLQSL